MKADSSALVYIIISIALLIISSIGKAKKQAGERPPARPPSRPPSPMDEPVPTGLPREFEEIFGKIFTQEQQPVPEQEIVYDNEEEFETSEIPQNYNPQYESLETITEEAESLESINITEEPVASVNYTGIQEEQEYDNTYIQDIDLEKAIIYSEIINRKYF